MSHTRTRRTVRLGYLTAALVLVVAVLVPVPAYALDGVWHDPYGIDDLYSTEQTERHPRDPMAGESVHVDATTWPVEFGQSVWITWTRNGVPQTPIGASWQYNSGNNSYWRVALGSFDRGDVIAYTVHADHHGTNQKSTGEFEFTVTSWSHLTDVTAHTDNGTSVDVTTGDSAGDFTPKVRLAFPTTDSFRLQVAPSGSGLDIAGIGAYTVSDSGGTLQIATSDLVLRIQKSPFRLSVYEGDGTTLITRQYDPGSFHNIGWASDGATTITKIEEHFLTPGGERFEGFGERYDTLDQRGRDVHNYVFNQYLDQGSHSRTYLSVPFFLNSAGYGVYIPTDRYTIFNIGTHLGDMAGFTADTGGGLDATLDYYFFTGTPEEIVDRYTEVSGRPQLPPKWAFGLWMSANEWNTQSEVAAELAAIDTHDIPHSVMVLEQWADEATFYVWHGATYTPTPGAGTLGYSDLTFPSGTAWSDPKAMVADLHDAGIKVLLWQIPVLKENFDTNPSTPPQQHLNDKAYAASQGYVVDDGSGNPYRIPTGQWFGDSMVPDFTSTAATAWWMSKRAYLLDEIGVDGFKTDGGELIFGRDVTFSDGRKGDELHNAYPNEYIRAYDEEVQDRTGGDGVLFSRAGTSGAQQHSIFWAGDQASTWGAFQEAMRAGLSAGQSGVPFWAWDMAGFTGNFPSAELYLRSAAQATFSPIMQYHSEKANPSPSEARTPWNVQARTGNSSVIPTFRKFANVRMNLIPYLYSEAKASADTGVPMMRSMSFAFPDDAAGAALDQQYMFGSQLLVAPITSQGASTKDVHVPDGEWYDFWNGGRFTGPGTKTYGAGWDTIPVYARPGAIIPLDLNDDYELGGSIGNDVYAHTNLVFRVYPSGASSYDYYDDAQDVHRTVSVTGDWESATVAVTVPALAETATLQVASSEPSAVRLGGSAMTRYGSVAALAGASQGWYWDPVQQLTFVKLASSGSTRSVVLDGVHKAAYEAEFAERTSTSVNSNHSGYTGTGFVDGFTSVGDAVTFEVNADSSATYDLRLRYANATGSSATRTVYVDDVAVGTVTLPSLASWNTWGTATIAADLGAGAHTVRVAYDPGDTGAINLDNLALEFVEALPGLHAASQGVQRVQFSSGSNYLVVELLDDDLAHFELSPHGPGPGTGTPLFTTDQVARTDHDGPTVFSHSGTTVSTAAMRIEVDGTSLCADVYDTARSPDLLLHTVCPHNLGQAWKGLTFTQETMEHAYGLGQQFFTGGSADGDWVGRVRSPGDNFGNAMIWDSDNGAVGNVQIPVLYALGPGGAGYGLFLDHLYKQQWDLTGDPWKVETWGDHIRWYVLTGADLPELRESYMDLTGRPPVPPRKALGLWVSEFGYRDWGEIDDTLDGLRGADFPVDGFVLDLYWFGGVTAGSDNSRMGSLAWDTGAFPDPAGAIAGYAADGVGLMTIEESYVARGLDEHDDLEALGYLVRDGCSTCGPVYLTGNDWWGRGGMIDWTQDAAGDYWHDEKRQPLVDDGIVGHWLDLGEPEMYDAGDWTAGVLPGKHAHADYHNAYNLKWAESVARGYERAEETQRPFMLSRSGAAGIQRHGVALWSGDIGTKLTALAAQQNAHLHMAMSGIDYYGSDIGGFRRELLDSDLDELYTQWFANGAWFEVPVRPHTENLCDCEATSPAEIGHVASNRENIRQRYELTPYYYSLAHRAHRYGEPVVPPVVYYHPDDPAVREMGHQKLVGRDLLVGIVAGAGERQRNIYLPEGDWVDYHSNERHASTGQWLAGVPLWRGGVFRLPAYARAGAILPKMHVDAQTKNVAGDRIDASTRDELVVRVYADETATSFTLYEDDGVSTAYLDGAVRTTQIGQELNGSTATVTIAAADGTYAGAPSSRVNVVELVVDGTQASAVTLGGSPLTQRADKAAFDAAGEGWYNAGGNLVVAKSASTSVGAAKTFAFTLGQAPVSVQFTCTNGHTSFGQSVYAVGSVPQLGSWSPASAVKLEPTSYPTWTGTIGNLPPNTLVEWKCIKRQESGYPDSADQWQPGANSTVTTPASGTGSSTSGSF